MLNNNKLGRDDGNHQGRGQYKKGLIHFRGLQSNNVLITKCFLFMELHSLYICLQHPRIISFSVVNMTEKLWCCQLDLGHFLSWLERFIQRNHKKKKKSSFFATFLLRGNDSCQNKLLKIIHIIDIQELTFEIRVIF